MTTDDAIDLDLTLEPSGCDEFDRGRALLRDGRDTEALDWFEIASDAAPTAEVRRSAALFVASLLLASGRPHEVQVWTERLRIDGASPAIVALFEASAHAQFGEYDAALEVLDSRGLSARAANDVADPWFPPSSELAAVVRGHCLVCLGRFDEATAVILDAFARAGDSADLWFALARLCADTDFDPEPIVAQYLTTAMDSHTRLFAWLHKAPPEGVDRIAELLWSETHDQSILAAATSFAGGLAIERAVEWTVRLVEAGFTKASPVISLARDRDRDTLDRARAASVAAAFDEADARSALEALAADVEIEELAEVVSDVFDLAPDIADSVVVGAATSTDRCLVLASQLSRRGADEEAVAVLVFGLSMDEADDLTTARFASLVPGPVRDRLASAAQAAGDDEVVAILRSVHDGVLATTAESGA